MTKLTAIVLGILAWAGVAALSVAIAFNMGGKNQVAMFVPIIAAVFLAWAIGEIVTDSVLVDEKEEG